MLVHKANLEQKLSSIRKYSSNQSRKLLLEIIDQYNLWHEANVALTGPHLSHQEDDNQVIAKRVALLNEYKDFIDQQVYAEHFDSRSNLHSSVIEEFLFYLFRDMVADFGDSALIGKSHAFKDMFFVPPNYRNMIIEPNA